MPNPEVGQAVPMLNHNHGGHGVGHQLSQK
jgi:hypothetical protein